MTIFIDHLAAIFVHYLALSSIAVLALLFAARRIKQVRERVVPSPVYPPVIHATRQPSWDETWADVWPTAEEAEQVVYDRLFDRLVAEIGR